MLRQLNILRHLIIHVLNTPRRRYYSVAVNALYLIVGYVLFLEDEAYFDRFRELSSLTFQSQLSRLLGEILGLVAWIVNPKLHICTLGALFQWLSIILCILCIFLQWFICIQLAR